MPKKAKSSCDSKSMKKADMKQDKALFNKFVKADAKMDAKREKGKK